VRATPLARREEARYGRRVAVYHRCALLRRGDGGTAPTRPRRGNPGHRQAGGANRGRRGREERIQGEGVHPRGAHGFSVSPTPTDVRVYTQQLTAGHHTSVGSTCK
jgi:hypothetical protein